MTLEIGEIVRKFAPPPVITDLVRARNRLRDHYSSAALEFILDSNLIGNNREAVAAELFGLKISACNGTGITAMPLTSGPFKSRRPGQIAVPPS